MEKFPKILMIIAAQNFSGKVERPPLQEFLDPPRHRIGSRSTLFFDTYYGPVSRRAQAILRTIKSVGSSQVMSESILNCMFIAVKVDHPKNPTQVKSADQFKLYSNFVKQVTEEDSIRVSIFERTIATIDDPMVNLVCGKWLKITVQLDGLRPKIRRELLVSPEITIKCLRDQVLCPAFGWKSNYHSYAFRNRTDEFEQEPDDAPQILKDECWIGPKVRVAYQL